MKLQLTLGVFCFCLTLVTSIGLTEYFQWTRISYDWSKFGRTAGGKYLGSYNPRPGLVFPDDDLKSKPEAIPLGIDYQYENNIPMGANVWKDKLFITVPRRRLGVPSTLNYVPLNSRNQVNPPLIPYPNSNINLYPGGLNNLVSVYRVAIDSCDRMWLVDTGVIELPGNATRIKPATLHIIDLVKDQIILSYTLPDNTVTPQTSLASVTLEVEPNQCGDAFAYLPDLAGYGLIVYSLRQNLAWRVTHNYFFLEPQGGEFRISGHDFQWNDGIFSAELSPRLNDGSRELYFHSMAGFTVYKVNTRILKDQTLATRSYHGNDFQIVGSRGKKSQTSSADLHQSSGVMFLGLVNQNALGCWRLDQPAESYGIVQKDDQKMIYPCDVKIVKDKVYVLTNTMPEFLYGRLNYDRVNFRIWSSNVADAVKQTPCEASRGGQTYGGYRG